MQTYTIELNEDQRLILIEALQKIPNNPLSENEKEEEAGLLLDMFTSLPEDEQKDPGCLHGFCY